ncbi:MAG: MoaD/ThiS family protein [Ruminococcus sp.]|nr:MoaD/ThiS family protein [Candidatus Copronaster equi]
MAEITVKLFGVYRTDTHISSTVIDVQKVIDIFPVLNQKVDERFLEKKKENPSLEKPDPIQFKDAVVYIDGERCSKKGRVLKSGEEVWIMSPASGG